MEAYNYQWSSQFVQDAYYNQEYNYTPNCYHSNWQAHPTFSWNYNNQVSYSPEFSYSPPQPQEQKSKLEELLENFIGQNEKMLNTQEVYTPLPIDSPGFSYKQPPPQQEETSNLEDVLAKFITATEMRMNNQDKIMSQLDMNIKSQSVAIRNLEIQMEQLVNVVINWPPYTLPIEPEIDPKEDHKEEANISECGKEFQELVEGNPTRLHLDGEDDGEVENKKSKNGEKEKTEDDAQTLNAKGIKQSLILLLMSFLQKYQKSEECFRINLVDSRIKDANGEISFFQLKEIDEFKFGGVQSSEHAMKIKEKMKRRHAKIIFAIEPD